VRGQRWSTVRVGQLCEVDQCARWLSVLGQVCEFKGVLDQCARSTVWSNLVCEFDSVRVDQCAS